MNSWAVHEQIVFVLFNFVMGIIVGYAIDKAEGEPEQEPVAAEAIHAAWSAGFVEGEKAALEQQALPVVNQTGETNGRHDEFRSDLHGIMAVGRDTSRAISGEKPASLMGHCKEKAKPGGCQLHNLQCGYPACDRPVTPPQQQAEPVAWYDGEKFYGSTVAASVGLADMSALRPLYTAPPQRQWVGLTDEDFLEVCQIAERGNYLLAFQRIQIKLKEKNT